jgi:hypothetical protein
MTKQSNNTNPKALAEKSYKTLVLDSTNTNRRYHIAFDTLANPVPVARLVCPFCNSCLIEKADHPPLVLVRLENLNKRSEQPVLRCLCS